MTDIIIRLKEKDGKFIAMDILQNGSRTEYANEALEDDVMSVDDVLFEIKDCLKRL